MTPIDNEFSETEPAEDPPDPSLPSGAPSPARRGATVVGLTLLLLAGAPLGGQSTKTTGSPDAEPVPAAQSEPGTGRAGVQRRSWEQDTQDAIDEGLAWLAREQDASGRFGGQYSVAVTALAGLAFLGNGVEYGRGDHGNVLIRAVEYLLDAEEKTRADYPASPGFINDGDNAASRMHGHAYALLFLSQILGSADTPKNEDKIRDVVERGIRVILDSQTARGGWDYLPPGRPGGSKEMDEASITVCCLQALRAANNAGIAVSKAPIDRAIRYLKDCCLEDGSFRYSLSRRSQRSTYELTAAAVSSLDAAGEYALEEHQRGIGFMRKILDRDRFRRNPWRASRHYPYYGNLYAAQVFFQIGGRDWDEWYQPVREWLIEKQTMEGDTKGNWQNDRFGDFYATAVALLILEVPMGYLPIFER